MTENNPFTPNFGQIPKYIAGREQVISEVLRALEGNSVDPARTSIFIGARGTGKTALLSYFSHECRSKGWISVNVNCIPGVQEDILQQLASAAQEFIPRKDSKTVTGVSFGQLFGVSWKEKEQNPSNWRSRITEALMELEEYGAGLLITIDEVTASLDEMIQIASIYQLLLRENRKIALLMAGLPSEVSALLNERSVSFLRRSSQYVLGRIEDHDIELGLKKTVDASGKTITPEALLKAVKAIDGFPYMMQLVGYRSWQQAENENVIGVREADEGIRLAEKDFESRVLKATAVELSKVDIQFIKAMLPDEDVSEVSQIEKRMRKNAGYISRYRIRLIEQGVIEQAGRGKVRVSLPGLKKYIGENY